MKQVNKYCTKAAISIPPNEMETENKPFKAVLHVIY